MRGALNNRAPTRLVLVPACWHGRPAAPEQLICAAARVADTTLGSCTALWFRAAAGTGYVETAREEAMIAWPPGRDGQWFEGAARGLSGFSHGGRCDDAPRRRPCTVARPGPGVGSWASRIWLPDTGRNGRRSAAWPTWQWAARLGLMRAGSNRMMRRGPLSHTLCSAGGRAPAMA